MVSFIKLVITEANFTATFAKLSHLGLEYTPNNNMLDYLKDSINQALQVKNAGKS